MRSHLKLVGHGYKKKRLVYYQEKNLLPWFFEHHPKLSYGDISSSIIACLISE